jgi:tRNA threonylcarbamoyladenosine biosynthesis protein TsaB
MGHVLAIDTSSGTSVAVLKDGIALAEIEIADTRSHTESIGDAINDALIQAGVKPNQIRAVAVGRGPAPFTGLRVGIAAAIMFAEGAGAKLFGLVSLDAIAKQEFETRAAGSELDTGSEVGAGESGEGSGKLLRPLLVTSDARRSEHYWALYSGLDRYGVPICIEGPAVNRPADIAESLAARGIEVQTTSRVISARAIGALFEAQAAAGMLSQDVTALYLRNPDAVEPKNLRTFGKKVSS